MPLIVPTSAQLVDGQRRVTPVWLQFFIQLAAAANAGGGGAPDDAVYVVGTADPDLPNARVLTDSPSVDFDLGTPAQVKAHVIVDPAGALDGGVSGPLAVRPDGVTVQINGSNELEAIGGAWAPLTTGAEPMVFVSDGAGAPVMVAFTP